MKHFKLNMLLKLYSMKNLPLLAFVNPNIIELTSDRSVVEVKLGYRTRNHLNVMYFGALSIGAELSVAIKAVEAIYKSKQKIDFIFKDFSAEFLKRSDGDVQFICEEAAHVEELVEKAKTSPERFERTFNGYAIVPSKSKDPVMKYTVTLSIKNRSLKK